MNWATIINTLVFGLEVFVGVFGAIHLANIQKQKMSEHITARLEQFARQAVQKVEQQNKTMGGSAKKQLAVNETMKLFQAFKLPAPTYGSVDTAIEAAVFLLSKENTSKS